MAKDLIGKYCLVYMTLSKTEFRPEISVITGLHNLYPDSYVFLDNNEDSLYHVKGLLITEYIEALEELLEVQKDYLEELNTLRNKIHNLKKGHYVTVNTMIKEIKK